MTNKEKLNALLTQVAELLKGDDVYPVEPFGHSSVEGGLTIIPTDQFRLMEQNIKHLSNLLAHIHQDGGHYQSEHGTEKAVEDAIEKVGELLHDHPDIKRLDYLLQSAKTYRMGYNHVILCLDRTYYISGTDSLNPRDVIDKAMEDDE